MNWSKYLSEVLIMPLLTSAIFIIAIVYVLQLLEG
jgi:hypothetical protein